MGVRVQREDFDIGAEVRRLTAGRTDIGAIVTFTGTVRGDNDGDARPAMTLEHYPGMTEPELARVEAEAAQRWPLQASLIVHRVGTLKPGDNIVLVVTASAHREAAFAAAEFLMDYLKTRAPFWKKEARADGSRALGRRPRQRRRRGGAVGLRSRLRFIEALDIDDGATWCRRTRGRTAIEQPVMDRVRFPAAPVDGLHGLTAASLGQLRNKQVGRDVEPGAQPLHHCHAEPFLAAEDLADPAWRTQDRRHLGAREAVLVHQVPDQIGDARWPPWPLCLLVGGNQARLCLQARDIGRRIGVPKALDESACTRQLRIAVDQNQSCIHHTVSASILSYSLWVPKNLMARTPA